ncbi:MAG: ABC transporter transmembrane domain-containing protein [Planctomycetota bacterium]
MTNFARVVRIALRHRFSVAASVLCSLVVAVFWAGNITAVWPLVDAVMHGHSIPDWLEEVSEADRAKIEELTAQIDQMRARAETLPEEPRREALSEAHSLEQWRGALLLKQDTLGRVVPWARERLPATAFGTLAFVCVALFLGTLIKGLFRVLGTYFTARVGHLTGLELRRQFFRRTLRLDLGTLRQTSHGELMNHFASDLSGVAFGVQVLVGVAVREPLKAVACLIGAAWVSWQLLLLTLLAAPVGGFAVHWLAKSLKRTNRRALEGLTIVFERLEETLNSVKVIKAFTMESHERSRFHRASRRYYQNSMRIELYQSLSSPVTETIGIGIILAVMLAGGYLVLNDQTKLLGIRISDEPLSHGMLTLFYGFLAGASDPIRRLSDVFGSLQRASASSDRIYKLLDREPVVTDPAAPATLPERIGRIDFRGVRFHYTPDEPILRGIDLQVTRGETVAIVGPNGCGKSTLINLLPRFFDPVEGAVAIDGADIQNVRVRALRDRIGLVTQETVLLDDTVANNIRYGSPGATDAQVIEAAKRAHAHGFITEKLADGYETNCGARGGRLSGGQRQRLALARAILRDPEVLILDEATSQIDVESERLIHQVLEGFVRERTAFMVTHRPATLSLANRIVVMDQGQIVDQGTFDELAGRCELFRKLAHLDFRQSA